LLVEGNKTGNVMKKNYVLVLCLFALSACNKAEEAHTVTPPVSAPQALVSAGNESDKSMPLLARENNCTACHAIDKKLVGPAWMDVAKKYKGDANAEARLIIKVSKGGDGVWGTMPMPANDATGKKQDQIKQLVQFILALDK
jgi:cytochrome c